MYSNVIKVTGLVLAAVGTLSLANAQSGGEGGRRPRPPSAAEMIKKFDEDGDGKLSKNELQTMINDMKSRRPEGREGFGRGGGINREEMLKKYDADGDGKLSEEERKKMMEDLRSERRRTE